MTRINQYWHDVKLFVAVGLLLLVAGFVGAQWQQHLDRGERQALVNRFPKVRAEAFAAGVAKSAAQIDSLQKQLDAANARLGDFQDIKSLVADAHEIVAYTLRYLGKRAEITDARTAALLKQTKTAAAVAVETKQSLEKVDKKLTEQAAKVDAAASAAQNIEKNLAPPPAPPAPSKGWFGFGGH